MFPLLPPWVRRILRDAHERINALPPSCREAAISSHAREEEALCALYLNDHPEVMAELERQHREHDRS